VWVYSSIRGNSSIQGNNQALFVVDGVPIDNGNSNSADKLVEEVMITVMLRLTSIQTTLSQLTC
jgi:hypothetical protein